LIDQVLSSLFHLLAQAGLALHAAAPTDSGSLKYKIYKSDTHPIAYLKRPCQQLYLPGAGAIIARFEKKTLQC
jgi:hypothetical protein